jgi:CDP-diglyceride synthetase
MNPTYIAIWICLPLVAAFIAHRKQRSWVGALLLTFIAPPLGLLATLLTGSRSDGKGGSSARARYLFGLLPLWLALTALLVGGATTKSAEYWNAAPWLLVAAIPLSLLTLLLVEAVMWCKRARRSA